LIKDPDVFKMISIGIAKDYEKEVELADGDEEDEE